MAEAIEALHPLQRHIVEGHDVAREKRLQQRQRPYQRIVLQRWIIGWACKVAAQDGLSVGHLVKQGPRLDVAAHRHVHYWPRTAGNGSVDRGRLDDRGLARRRPEFNASYEHDSSQQHITPASCAFKQPAQALGGEHGRDQDADQGEEVGAAPAFEEWQLLQ